MSGCKSFYRVSLLLVVAFVCSSNGIDIDVGCRAEKAKMDLDLMHLFLEVHKSCTSGGLWRNIQCESRNKCQCVYVDSGKPMFGVDNYTTKDKLDNISNCPIKSSERSQDTCIDPPVQYPCIAARTKYFFNRVSGSCEEVQGKSCFGFYTLQQCQDRCGVSKCEQPINNGNSCGTGGSGIRYRFDRIRQACAAFYYNGCGGNENRFRTKWGCEQDCRSKSQVTLKLSLRNPNQQYNLTLPQWIATKEHLKNGNVLDRTRFNSIKEHATSVVPLSQLDDTLRSVVTIEWKNPKAERICKLPAKTGMCRAYFRRWFYDYKSGICKEFIYGGCMANENNFVHKGDCEEMCLGVTTPKSLQSRSQKSPSTGGAVTENSKEIVWTYQ